MLKKLSYKWTSRGLKYNYIYDYICLFDHIVRWHVKSPEIACAQMVDLFSRIWIINQLEDQVTNNILQTFCLKEKLLFWCVKWQRKEGITGFGEYVLVCFILSMCQEWDYVTMFFKLILWFGGRAAALANVKIITGPAQIHHLSLTELHVSALCKETETDKKLWT